MLLSQCVQCVLCGSVVATQASSVREMAEPGKKKHLGSRQLLVILGLHRIMERRMEARSISGLYRVFLFMNCAYMAQTSVVQSVLHGLQQHLQPVSRG